MAWLEARDRWNAVRMEAFEAGLLVALIGRSRDAGQANLPAIDPSKGP